MSINRKCFPSRSIKKTPSPQSGKPTKCSDISVENSASVWIFGSLLTNSQSRPKSDGTRIYKLARNEKLNNGEADKLTCKHFLRGLFLKEMIMKHINYSSQDILLFFIAPHMGRNIWFVICEVQTSRNL